MTTNKIFYTYDFQDGTHIESYEDNSPYDRDKALSDLADKMNVDLLIEAKPRNGERNDLTRLTEEALMAIGVTNVKPE